MEPRENPRHTSPLSLEGRRYRWKSVFAELKNDIQPAWNRKWLSLQMRLNTDPWGRLVAVIEEGLLPPTHWHRSGRGWLLPLSPIGSCSVGQDSLFQLTFENRKTSHTVQQIGRASLPAGLPSRVATLKYADAQKTKLNWHGKAKKDGKPLKKLWELKERLWRKKICIYKYVWNEKP